MLSTANAARVTPIDSDARLAHITPNWFTSVMGTGIVATASATLPVHLVGLHTVATAIWMLASVALVVVSIAFVGHWVRHTDIARGYLHHGVMSHFYGAPAMAAMTVGAGTLLFGDEILGSTAAVRIDAVLWTVGSGIGVAAVGVVIARLVSRHDRGGVALPARMMSVVAPMVSASTGALLVPHIADADLRLAFLLLCYGMFALSFVFGTVTTFLVYRRMIDVGLPARAAVPTVWIPLGMIGQSITAAIALGTAGRGAVPPAIAADLHAAGVVYGIVVGLIGIVAFTAAVAITVHTALDGLPFSLTWWSFTFPVGTCVTGASALGAATGIEALHTVAVAGYVALFIAWVVVATRTVAAIRSGALPAAA